MEITDCMTADAFVIRPKSSKYSNAVRTMLQVHVAIRSLAVFNLGFTSALQAVNEKVAGKNSILHFFNSASITFSINIFKQNTKMAKLSVL